MKRILSTIVALTCALIIPARADVDAGDYPNRPIKLIVPYSAGGGTDTIARFLGRALEPKLGVPIIIDNKPGAGTAIGATYVAKSPPDGYTLLIATSGTLAFNPALNKTLAYDPAVDFAPISMVASLPFVLVVNPKIPSFAAFIDLAKSKSGGLSFASAGIGSPHHVFMELLKSMVGIDVRHVPYRGGGPAMTDVIAGHVEAMVDDAAPALEQIRAGRVRALGVTTKSRIATMPDVPTLAELGVTGYEAGSWQCIVAPANLPSPIQTKLNVALVEVMKTPEAQSFFSGLGMQPLWSTPAENAIHIKAEIARWAPVIGGLNVTDK
jgi:tripartite-type tricarboxylate transporter receptor subunit TctC